MNLENLNEEQKKAIAEIKKHYKKVEPKIRRLDDQLSYIEESSMQEFSQREVELKERLINDINISDEELESKYKEELEKLSVEIFQQSEKRRKEIEEEYR